MALLKILHYPDPRLRTVAKPVERFDDELAKLVANMAETMYDAAGIGLAATQVNVHKQVIVMDLSEDHSDLKVFINPVIQKASDQKVPHQEGCLSVPGVFDEVSRPDLIHVRAQDLTGQAFELEAQGLLAVCLQHEMDHLNGKVFVDYLSRLKQGRIKTKLQKAEKHASTESVPPLY
jgi:peptide deformylase